ncbi:RIO1-domain-containing protein [Gonapodya prolifera JEL478]|uniref:Serine/threonine-protein kinase RIO2 n=1 Tax=Gonapodya prolifera (strain JEL478) TaxID=1344416 RepID=A0A139AAA3_GONPJ|nr:RIO1-domain-containing protein [Gonapodya prolifera JEL478]|eukprot:KXS13670.1 RIO1-domain-containing protein [Gonapodya prolifera JEL478]
MKLDVKRLRYLSSEEFRVLTAVEMGSRNHEVVPTSLISSIAQLRHGGAHKILAELARERLVGKVQATKYDGYRLTYAGYDYLALRTFAKRGSVYSVGNQIGVGKESDVYIVSDEEGTQRVLKLQRLGRTSFRTVRKNRDYLRNRQGGQWLYLSRLAAMKEYAFMKVLHEHGFPVPKPIDANRHCVVMELIDGHPLYQVHDVEDPGLLYSKLMDLVVRLAQHGLVHGDFNEFNILLTSDDEPILIDFPQMVSTAHENVEMYFNRDVECLRDFFRRRFNYESALFPVFSRDGERKFNLDIAVAASGFSRKHETELREVGLGSFP